MIQRIKQGVVLLSALILSMGIATAEKPKLVVNIVVGSMRASDLDRYADNFSYGGFRRLIDGGVRYTNAHYDYALTSTATGLATISTGCQPAVHGVVGEHWWNYVDGTKVEVIADNKAHPVEFSTGTGNYSAARLTAPTIGDMLLNADSQSKQFTIAIDPLSAIILNGKAGMPIWAERNKTHWVTSSAHCDSFPIWLKRYNSDDTNSRYILKRWTPLYEAYRYHNEEVAVVEDIKNKSTKLLSNIELKRTKNLCEAMLYTPAGNNMVLELAATLIALEYLGKDNHTDILNISLDTARYVAETYGPESIEYEDMLYRIDSALSNFFSFLYAQFDNPQDVVVMLTSDHGMAPSYNPVGGNERERFNTRQMSVLVNAYLGARYGSAEYVLGYANKALYLNHALILEKRLSLDDIREEVATFLLQIRGVSNAISASSLRNASFSEGRTRLMQQSYYPTRSGDVLIDLMPGVILDDDEKRSTADGGYNYDRMVPLIIYRSGKAESIDRKVSITTIAPTLAHIIGIDAPWASEADALDEF